MLSHAKFSLIFVLALSICAAAGPLPDLADVVEKVETSRALDQSFDDTHKHVHESDINRSNTFSRKSTVDDENVRRDDQENDRDEDKAESNLEYDMDQQEQVSDDVSALEKRKGGSGGGGGGHAAGGGGAARAGSA